MSDTVRFTEKLKQRMATLSIEFLPPKTPEEWASLYSTFGELPRLAPDFVSVTYGAGGSTLRKTAGIVERIQCELQIETVPHLTCISHSRSELVAILDGYQRSGTNCVMALRGDPPKVERKHITFGDGFEYASDLIAFLRDHYPFHIGCACYPEKHPQAESLERDIEYLKLKQDSGATFAVSQLFFDNEVFHRFRELAGRAGVTIPLIAGVLPISALGQLGENGFVRRCGSSVPRKLIDFVSRGGEVSAAAYGIEYAVSQCDELLRNGVAGIHLYTMNRAATSLKITRILRSIGHFQPDVKAEAAHV